MEQSRNEYRMLLGDFRKRVLYGGRVVGRMILIIKMDLREKCYDGEEWIDHAQNRNQWRSRVRAVMNVWDP